MIQRILIILLLGMVSAFGKPCMTDIYFGNGVWNPDQDQVRNEQLKGLKNLTENSNPTIFNKQNENVQYQWRVIYNPSYGTIDDIIETYWQLKESGQISEGYFGAVYAALTWEESGEFYNKLDDVIQHYNQDVITMLTIYQNASFNQKHNVLLVAHSQGNLWGNKMYTLLSDAQKQKFRMVSVGTPANHVMEPNQTAPYVTLYGDFIIRPISDSLPANTNGGGHSFVSGYLGKIDARIKISAYIKTAYNNLMQTASCSEYKYYVWISYLCPTRKAQELAVDIYGRPADAPYSYKKELVATDSRARMPQNINGNCSVSGDDMLSLFNEYDKNGCTAYSLDDTTGNSRSVDTVKANIYNNGYLCTQYKMKPEVVSVLKSMESF